jgi:hypothetical protein
MDLSNSNPIGNVTINEVAKLASAGIGNDRSIKPMGESGSTGATGTIMMPPVGSSTGSSMGTSGDITVITHESM